MSGLNHASPCGLVMPKDAPRHTCNAGLSVQLMNILSRCYLCALQIWALSVSDLQTLPKLET